MDDRTVGLVLRALRRRRGWRQVDLAARARSSQSVVSQLERGHLAGTTIETLREIFGAVEARLILDVRWRGAEADRLLDLDHAAIVEAVARRLVDASWQALLEVTYSIGPERGSIDVLGVDATNRAVLVAEIKSDVPSSEATGRKLDEKRRLAPTIVRERLGWTPAAVGVVLVLPESPRLRRLLAGQAASLARMFPIASRDVAAWLRRPGHPFAATWFLSDIAVRDARRVRLPRSAPRATTTASMPGASSTKLFDQERAIRILR